MNKFKSKKGFTLAELLIVVAIIAILVAIAVPLFVGALNDAEKRVLEANKRAVRAAAVEEILMDTDDDLLQDTSGTDYKAWGVKASVNASGEITYMKITPQAGATADAAFSELIKSHNEANCTKITSDNIGNHSGVNAVEGGYYIELIIKELSLNKE